MKLFASQLFLPTPSARRATHPARTPTGDAQFLPTPSARRATPAAAGERGHQAISTHALREEGDKVTTNGSISGDYISTHALREEGDLVGFSPPIKIIISTHALREEGDSKCAIK